MLSWEALTGRRLFTTNLLYKVFTPPQGYPEVKPKVDTTKRRVYKGFDNIALFQSITSILGWGILALALASKLKNIYIKMLSVVLILLFGFSPQVADWDSVLGAEALSFSLFALSLGLLIWLLFDIYENKKKRPRTVALAVIWFIIFFLWSFARDTNLYALFSTCIMLLVALIAFRQYRRSLILIILLVALATSLGLGLASSMQSERSNIQIKHAIFEYILPYPARAEFMYNLGMPYPESPEFEKWFDRNAPGSYVLFLIAHPRYTLSKNLHGTYVAFNPYMQSYFRVSDLKWRTQLINFGEVLHPNTAALVIALILLSVLWVYTISDKISTNVSKPWAWLTTWIFLTGSSTLFISIFGDTVALHRHAIFSTTELRLLMWILLVTLSDLLLLKNSQESV